MLRVDREQIDAARFEQLLREARAAAEPGRRAKLLRRHSSSYAARPSPISRTSRSRTREAVRLDELCIAALEERIEADLASGLHAELIAELEALVAAHPLRERSQALLMQALYQSGRQADALAVYREARRKLVEELGVEPGNELRELERAILTHAASLGPASDAAAAPPTLPAPATPLIRARAGARAGGRDRARRASPARDLPGPAGSARHASRSSWREDWPRRSPAPSRTSRWRRSTIHCSSRRRSRRHSTSTSPEGDRRLPHSSSGCASAPISSSSTTSSRCSPPVFCWRTSSRPRRPSPSS